MIQKELLAVLNTYSCDGYFTYGNIPSNKLHTAIQHYPVDLNDTPLALIDATVFGSAKNGMVIGLKGLYWRNSRTGSGSSERNFVAWEELADSAAPMGRSTFSIQMAPGCEFNMSGASMAKQLLVNLLNQLVALYKDHRDRAYDEPPKQNDVEITRVIESPVVGQVKGNEAGEEEHLYEELVPVLIAICITADGEVEEGEVEMAAALIENDQLIGDKQRALEALSASVEELAGIRSKAKAVYRLRVTSILSKLGHLRDDLIKERLGVILDGMMETVSDEGVEETATVVDTVRGRL